MIYLLQRLNVSGSPRTETDHITSAFRPDYMGAAEFEFGAFPKNITRMYEHIDDFTCEKVEVIEFHKPVTVYVFKSEKLLRATNYRAGLDFNPDTPSFSIDYLNNVKKLASRTPGDYRLKCYSDFPGDRSFGKPGEYKTVAWVDIQHGAFITLVPMKLDEFKNLLLRQVSFQQRK